MHFDIGDTLEYVDAGGEPVSGVVLNTLPTTLTDTATGERFTGRKYFIWNEQRHSGEWASVIPLRTAQEDSHV